MAESPPIRVFCRSEDGFTPCYQSELAAGADLKARVSGEIILAPGERARVPTGVRLAVPPDYEAQVRPRSGLAARHGVTVLNSPGTVDADFRGEIEVILINLGQQPFTIRRGDRIAQLVFAPVCRAEFEKRERLGGTHRGEAGFGSTGV